MVDDLRVALKRARDVLASSELRSAHEPTIVPPCRVCGGELSMQRVGGGEPTIWGCADGGNNRRCADDHYSQSRFEDRRHPDRRVIEALDALAALADCVESYVLTATEPR